MREAIEQRPVAIERSFHPEALNYKRETHRTAPLRFAIEHTVSSVFGIRREALWNASRGVARVALARQTAMYLAHTVGGLSLTEVGHMFERDRTTVAHACAVVEDRRDDPNFDRALELLERAIHRILARRDGVIGGPDGFDA